MLLIYFHKNIFSIQLSNTNNIDTKEQNFISLSIASIVYLPFTPFSLINEPL